MMTMSARHFLALIGMLLLLIGCQANQTLRYSGDGTFQDLAKVRYHCVQTHGACGSGFDACVAANGFYRNAQGNLDANSMAIYCPPSAADVATGLMMMILGRDIMTNGP